MLLSGRNSGVWIRAGIVIAVGTIFALPMLFTP